MALGVPFEVAVPEVEELTTGEPEETVIENARRKARTGVEMSVGEAGLVVGVDTEVVLDGRLLGKARNEGEARERLEALSGRTHEVLSGLVTIAAPDTKSASVRSGLTNAPLDAGAAPSVHDPGPEERAGLARSKVTFRELSEPLLAAYLASGEWRDRAGAYAVQGLGSSLVERVDGDLSNVIGLPVNLLLELAPGLLD
ncbi:MAG: Maf family protein [Solirubrobacterales bacterium]